MKLKSPLNNLPLNIILEKNKDINLIYKNFEGHEKSGSIKNINEYEIIKESFNQKIAEDRIIYTNQKATDLMLNSDLVLFDMISTGFSEAINIKVPTMVYGSKFYYNQMSQDGKKINDKLKSTKILFYDEKSGLESLSFFLNNFENFILKSKEIVDQYIEMNSFPINKSDFVNKMNNILK